MEKKMNSKKLMEQIEPWKNFGFYADKSGFHSDGWFWKADTLYKAAKEQNVRATNYDISYINFDVMPWCLKDLSEFAHHYKRIAKADTSIPIIICPKGEILDGYHRIIKLLLLDGKTKIKAYRLKTMPEPDTKEDE